MICQTCVSLFRPSELFNIIVPRLNQVPRKVFLFILIWLFHSCKVRLNCHRITPCVYSFSCEICSLVLYLFLYLSLYLSFRHLRSFSFFKNLNILICERLCHMSSFLTSPQHLRPRRILRRESLKISSPSHLEMGKLTWHERLPLPPRRQQRLGSLTN